jgi:hypothetical protein
MATELQPDIDSRSNEVERLNDSYYAHTPFDLEVPDTPESIISARQSTTRRLGRSALNPYSQEFPTGYFLG